MDRHSERNVYFGFIGNYAIVAINRFVQFS